MTQSSMPEPRATLAGLSDSELEALAQTILERDEAQIKSVPVTRSMFNALRLSMELALFSILGLGVIAVFWAPRVFLPMEPRWHVNVERKEPVLFDLPNRKPLDEILCFFNLDVSTFLFFPLSFVLYIKATTKETVMIVLLTTLSWLVCRGYGYKHFGMTSASIPVMTPALTLRIVLGRGTMVPMAYMQAVVSVAIGFLLYAVLYLFPADTDGRKLFLVAAVIPFFKEAAYAGARSLAKHMAFSPKICIPGRRLRRELSWVIHLWVQIMMGLAVRLFVSRFETAATLTAAVATQSAFEIFSRVTMNWRDRQMSRFFQIFFHQKDAAAVVVPSNLQHSLRHVLASKGNPNSASSPILASLARLDTKASEREIMRELFQAESSARVRAVHELCSKHFHSTVIAGEMLSEYLAILLTPFILLCYEHRQLQLPFDMYAQHGEFLAYPLNRRTLLSGMALQLAAELAVDTICLHYEHAAGFDVMGAWRLRPPYLVWLLIWAAWYASMACYSIVSDLDHFDQCQVGNMCKCAFGHGLHPQGVRQLYCEYIYNVSSWDELVVILPLND